jgi:glycosyltransferase involved in cell wall biosynthesis
VVIPAYDEVGGVGRTVARVREVLRAVPQTFSILVVDDGSTDGTAEEAEAHGATVIRLPENRGYGAALKVGIAESDSEYVAIIDADGTYPAEALPRLIELMPAADMTVGARAMNDRSIQMVRRPAKLVLGALASYLVGRRIPDLNSGLRIMRRSVLSQFLHLLPGGFSFTTTITLAMLCSNYRVVYLPVTCQPRVGSSKLRPGAFASFIMLVLRTIVLFNPLKIFLPVGAMLFGIGVVKFAVDLYRWNLSETAVMAFLAAIVVWSVGLLADMIARLQLKPRGAQ